MPHFSFHPGFSGIVMLVMAVAAIVLIVAFYRRSLQTLGKFRWLLLCLLRTAAVIIVLLLLFRPVFSWQRQIAERRALVFLIDNSKSMSIKDDAEGGTRLEKARGKLLNWQQQLEDDFNLHFVAFSDAATLLEGPKQIVDLAPNGKATSLSRALLAAGKSVDPRNTEAVFLLSDGIHNSAGDPNEAAARVGSPVHTIGIGNSLQNRRSYRDVRMASVECPRQMAVDNRARLTARVDAVGLPGRVLKVIFEEDDQKIAEQEIVLDDAEGLQEVTAEFIPAKKGMHTYTARIPAAREEKIVENNLQSTSGMVTDSRIRVLYIEGTLRSEYGALVGRFLSKDPNIEFCALVQTRPNIFTRRSNIEDIELTTIPNDAETLEQFDVFLIGDLDATYLTSEQMEIVRNRVSAGAGLLMMGGYHSLGPGGYQGTPLESVLPVFVGDREVGQITDAFTPVLTPEGRRHLIFSNITQFFPLEGQLAEVEGMPPLEGCVRVLDAKPGATVLAVHPSEQVNERPMPVLAVQRFGEGRGAAFTGDTTRNWHQTLRTLDLESPFLRFWGQTVRWLAGRSEEVASEAGISAATDKAYYEPESEVAITATVRGKEGEAGGGARVVATIRGPEIDTQLNMTAEAGPAGNFRLVYEPPISGAYEIEVQATLDGESLEAEKLVINVGRPNLEFDKLDLDEKMLIAIANQTGGRYGHYTTADRLIARLNRQRRQREVTLEVPLFWPPAFWLCFVGVLTTEWLLRRRYQLR